MNSTTEQRSALDWTMFSIIHVVLIGAIAYAGIYTYGAHLGAWVAASALIAGLVSMYLFVKIVPGETAMKIILGLFVALNAGYLVHNGARSIGIEAFNNQQIQKFETGMAEAAKTRSWRVAKQLGLSARSASELAKLFDDGVTVIAALLAFLELASGIVIFSIASRRVDATESNRQSQSVADFPAELEAGK